MGMALVLACEGYMKVLKVDEGGHVLFDSWSFARV